MKNNFFIFLGKIYLILFFSSNAFANVISPENFIQIIVDDAKKILISSNSVEYRSEKLIELAKEKVDIIINKSLNQCLNQALYFHFLLCESS